MTSSEEDALHAELGALREVAKQLAADVMNLQQQIQERDGEILALRMMQIAWPPRFPDEPLVQH